MDELEIEGKRYLSSRRAAKEHRYHIDYIGQLIRGGKVTGKKVGRSWYVEESSLKNYLKQEAGEKVADTSVAEVLEVEDITTEPEPAPSVQHVAVEEVVEPRVAQPVASAPKFQEPFVQEKREVYISVPEKTPAKPSNLIYIQDDEPMIPVLEGRVRPNADFVSIPMRRVTEEREPEEISTFEEESEQVFIEEKPRVSRVFSRTLVLATIAVVVLVAAATASSILAVSIKVTEGQAASVVYTIK